MRFCFSIRDVLWLTLVVAMGLGWFIHQRQLQAEVRQLRTEIMDASAVAIGIWRAGALELEGRKVIVDVASSAVKIVGPRIADETIMHVLQNRADRQTNDQHKFALTSAAIVTIEPPPAVGGVVCSIIGNKR